MQTFDTVYGRIQAPDWPGDLILTSLSRYGEWAYCEQLLLAPLLRHHDVLWDGGAFLGTFGLGVAQLAKSDGRCPARLVAIEPGAELYPHLLRNLEINAPCPFEVATVAIGPASGRLRASASAGDEAGRDEIVNHGAISYSAVGAETSGDAVPSRALRELRHTFGAYDVLKLDIEGMEAEALRDDFEDVRDRQPVIWAECNESLKSIELLEVLVAAGYDPLYVAFPAFRHRHGGTGAGADETIFPMAYEAVLLAAPRDRQSCFDPAVVGEEVVVQSVRTSWDLRQALWRTPRWARPEWSRLSRPELVALLGRLTQGTDLRTFLNDRPLP